MNILKYFTSKPKKKGAYILRKLGVRTELRLLYLWKVVQDELQSNNITEKTSKQILTIIKLSIHNWKTIATDIIELLQFINIHVIQRIGASVNDPGLVWLFDNKDIQIDTLPSKDKLEEQSEIQLSEYLYYCISEYGLNAIDRLSISELAILKRFKDISTGQNRIRMLYDNAMASNYSQNIFSSYVRDIQSAYKYKSTVDEQIYQKAKEDQQERTKRYEGLSDDEIEALAYEEYKQKYSGSGN